MPISPSNSYISFCTAMGLSRGVMQLEQLVNKVTCSDRSLSKGALSGKKMIDKNKKHTTGGIPRWSPTLVLVARFSAYVWQSGRDAQFSLTYGRMCLYLYLCNHDRVHRKARYLEVASEERMWKSDEEKPVWTARRSLVVVV
jgi:hypothetical protein